MRDLKRSPDFAIGKWRGLSRHSLTFLREKSHDPCHAANGALAQTVDKIGLAR